MVLSHLFGKETVVGIDIGSSCIKAVELEPAGNGWRLVNAAMQATPPESVRDGVITNILDVSSAVRTLLRSANIKANGAISAISGSQVIVRQVQFPKMSEAALRKSIKFEASKFVTASMEDSIIEFEILGDEPDTGQMNVMVVAAPREMVEGRVAVLESAGVEPLAIDVEGFCLIRSLVEASSDPGFANRNVALIDMGGSHTDVNIVSNREFSLTRNIPIAGSSFTNAIKTLTGFTFEDAERLKFEMTLQDSVDRLSSQETENKCWKVVQPLLDELLREIRRSIHYYQSQYPEGADQGQVTRVILSGGTSKMPGMVAYVSSKLNIPVEIGDVFANGLITPGHFGSEFVEDYGPVLAVGIGLALKEELVRAKLPLAA